MYTKTEVYTHRKDVFLLCFKESGESTSAYDKHISVIFVLFSKIFFRFPLRCVRCVHWVQHQNQDRLVFRFRLWRYVHWVQHQVRLVTWCGKMRWKRFNLFVYRHVVFNGVVAIADVMLATTTFTEGAFLQYKFRM